MEFYISNNLNFTHITQTQHMMNHDKCEKDKSFLTFSPMWNESFVLWHVLGLNKEIKTCPLFNV